MLGGEFDVDQAAGGELHVPWPAVGEFGGHQGAHVPDVGGGPGRVAGAAQGRLDGGAGVVGEGLRRGPHHPRAGHGQELPGLGLLFVVALERSEAHRHRSLGSRGAQPQVDLVEPALAGGG